MKTCQNCGTSLPDFVNVCTKCKFNLASPPPVKPAAPPPSAQATPPTPRAATPTPPPVEPVSTPSFSSSSTVATPPKKNKMAMYIGIGVLVIIVLAWIGSNKSGSDEAKLAKEQAAAEIAKAKAEASEAQEQAKIAQEQIQKTQDQASQPPSAPINDLLAQAAKCTISNCVSIMLQAAQPRNPEAIQVAAGRYGEFNTLKTGDRPAARNLNTQGLAQLRAGNVNGAIELFTRATNTDPNDSEIMGNLGYALVQAGRLEEGDKALNLALLINPRRTATWGAVAEFFAKKPNSTEAAVRCLQLGYEFSGNRDKTLSYYAENSATSDRPEMRPIYAEVVRRIRANY